MIPHSHHTHEHSREKARHSQTPGAGMRWHKDWRTWAVIAVMLAAIGTYVLTLDDSVQVSGPPPAAVSSPNAPVSPAK